MGMGCHVTVCVCELCVIHSCVFVPMNIHVKVEDDVCILFSCSLCYSVGQGLSLNVELTVLSSVGWLSSPRDPPASVPTYTTGFTNAHSKVWTLCGCWGLSLVPHAHAASAIDATWSLDVSPGLRGSYRAWDVFL